VAGGLAFGLAAARTIGIQHSIALPVNRHVGLSEFFPGMTRGEAKATVAALIEMDTDQYLLGYGGTSSDSLLGPTVPYDMQECDPINPNAVSFLSNDSRLRIHYGQENQLLYRKVPGPEIKACKMGASRGGPVVLF
jgi:hypothetical protein